MLFNHIEGNGKASLGVDMDFSPFCSIKCPLAQKPCIFLLETLYMLTSRSLISLALISVMAAPCALAQTSSPAAMENSEQAAPSNFTWDRFKTVIKSNTRVTFTNGVMLAGSSTTTNAPAAPDVEKTKSKNKENKNDQEKQTEKKEQGPNKRIVAYNAKKKLAETVAENDVTYIAAAYPSLTKARVAIVGQSCTQTECRPQDTKFVVVDGDFIKTYSIEDAQKVEIRLQDGDDVWAKAEGITMGNDAYGAAIQQPLTFKPGLGFISNSLNPRFQDMVGKHPEQFLNDPNIRDILLSKMGNDGFLQFRERMKVASGAKLVRGKFLLLQGCEAHNCVDNLATLLIDGATGDMWWCSSEAGKLLGNNGSTLPPKLRRLRTSELHSLAPSIDLDHEYLTIDVSYDGLLQILER
jgi:hypothetical protein